MKRAKALLAVVVVLAVALPAVLVGCGLVPYRVFVVRTGSMAPTIPTESLVVVRVGEPKLGEPITFYKQDGAVTHRWVGVNSDGTLQTKGDGVETVDVGSVNKSDVIGGVVGSFAKLGYWFMYFKNPYTLVGLLLLFLSAWVAWPLMARESKKSAVQAA